jgi:hypothetical protein
MYRVHSKCGYPKAKLTIVDFRISGDFDVAYASLDGFKEDQDLTFEPATLETQWNGNLMSDKFTD